MSYEPLHHKYRPQTFKDLVGQSAIANTLINAIELVKIAPAYLFTGPRGTGKTSSARILAKSLNCLATNQPTATPCGKCDVCRAIAAGTALDVIEIDAASNTGVDNIREIIERSRFAPVQSRYKVYAIDECHMLSTAAFNALLKTLEEPPPRVVFILATTDPQRVLPTIISRCQRFDYRRIPLEAMVQHLKYIAEQEKIAIELEALTLVAQLANGGLRDAESLLDQLSLFPDTITIEKVWDLVGVVSERDLLSLLIAIRKQEIEAILAQCRGLLDRGREPLVVLQNLASFYLNLLIIKTAPNRQDLIAVTETCRQQLAEEAKYWEINQILQGQQHLKEGEVQIKNTTQPRLWLEVILLGLLNKTFSVSDSKPESLLSSSPSNRLSSVTEHSSQNNVENNVIPFPVPNNIETEAKDHSSLEKVTQKKVEKSVDIPQKPLTENLKQTDFIPQSETEKLTNITNSSDQEAIWQQVINCTQPPMTQALLRQKCHLINLNEHTAVVGISSAPLLKVNQGKIPNIEAAFAKVCQRKIKVVLEVAPLPEEEKKNSNSLKINSFQPVEKRESDLKESRQESISPEPREIIPTTSQPEKARASIPLKQEEKIPVVVQENLTQENLPKSEPAIEEPCVLNIVETFSEDNSDEFSKAVELMAKKFDGEIIELQDPIKISNSVNSETMKQISQENTTQQHQVVVKREVIADYDDDNVPF